MHLLPEAFESQAGAKELFATLLVGLVFFFLLDKAELWHHGHEHHGGEHHGPEAAAHAQHDHTGHVHAAHSHHGHHATSMARESRRLGRAGRRQRALPSATAS